MSQNDNPKTIDSRSDEEFVSYLRRVGADQAESGREFTAQDYLDAADWIESLSERLTLAQDVYEAAYDNTESFRSADQIGADLAYLLGAILNDGCVDWSKNAMDRPPALLTILSDAFPGTSPLWKHILL